MIFSFDHYPQEKRLFHTVIYKNVFSSSLTCKYFMLFAPLHKITKLLSAAMDLEMIYFHKKISFSKHYMYKLIDSFHVFCYFP